MSSLTAWGHGVLCGTVRGTRLGGHSQRHRVSPYHNSQPQTLIAPRGCWHIWGLQMGTHVALSCPLTRCKHLALLTLTQGKHSTEDGGTGNDHPQPQGLAAGHRLCLFGGRIFLTAHWPPLSAGKTGGDWTPSAGAACSSPNLCSPAAPSTSPVPSSQGKSRPPYFWWGVFSGSSGQTPMPWEGAMHIPHPGSPSLWTLQNAGGGLRGCLCSPWG